MFLSRLCFLVSVAIGAGSVDKDKYKKLGGEAVLRPDSVSVAITSIAWKHGPDIAVEWYGGEPDAYREFKGRCKLDFSTGALTISNLTVKDSGIYTAEINNKVMSPTEITVISAVPKPAVSKQCSSEETRCTFTCEANVTGAEPVTYSWMVDGKNITGSSKSLEKEKDDPEMVGKPISCWLENPVSSARSDDVTIPTENGNLVAVVAGVTVTVGILIVAAVLLYHFVLRRRGSLNFPTEPSGRPQEETSGQTEEGADESQRLLVENGTENQRFHLENTSGTETSGRPQEETSGQTEEGADEETPFVSMSNGIVTYTKVDKVHSEEQNSPQTGNKAVTSSDSEEVSSEDQPEPVPTHNTGRPQEETSGQTEEGADVTSSDSEEVSSEDQPEPVPTHNTEKSEEGTPRQEEEHEDKTTGD